MALARGANDLDVIRLKPDLFHLEVIAFDAGLHNANVISCSSLGGLQQVEELAAIIAVNCARKN